MSTRREFLSQSLAAGGALVLANHGLRAQDRSRGAAKPLRILILGGTGYIGPHYVHAALARGHQVSVFSRGKASAKLPPEVEQLIGDRNGDLESIKKREWDSVIDLATFVPAWVRSLGNALQDRVKHYTLISSVATYQRPAPGQILREDGALRVYQGSEDPYTLDKVIPQEYGSLKVLCELEAEKQFPGRVTVLRPGYIAGPGDHDNKVMQYWLARLSKGGEVLVSGSPSVHIQYIDVRDMAEWTIRLTENSATGIYNTVGPAVLETLGQFIECARAQVGTSQQLSWVDPEWLATQGDKTVWFKQLFWSYEPDVAWMMRMDNRQALREGLTLRPLSTTLSAILESLRTSPEAVTDLVKPMTWDAYLAEESAALSAWHAKREP